MEEVNCCFGVALLPLVVCALKMCLALKSKIAKSLFGPSVTISIKDHGRDLQLNTHIIKHPGWFKRKHLTEWPAVSTNVNLIENLWSLKRSENSSWKKALSNLRELEQHSKEEWTKEPVKTCGNLIKDLTATIFPKVVLPIIISVTVILSVKKKSWRQKHNCEFCFKYARRTMYSATTADFHCVFCDEFFVTRIRTDFFHP